MGEIIDANAHRIAKALLTWDVRQHGRPSTWDLGRGTGRGAIAVARVLEAYRASGLAVITGRDRNGARQWRLTAEGEKFARQALAAVEETKDG